MKSVKVKCPKCGSCTYKVISIGRFDAISCIELRQCKNCYTRYRVKVRNDSNEIPMQ